MVRHASLFCQLLEFFPRHEFHNLVRDIGTERRSKGFASWDHFVAMLFCQLAQAKSLREISNGLASCLGRLSHLGVCRAPNKSTPSYANGHRSWTLFESLFYRLSDRLQFDGHVQRRLKLPGKLYSLDATVISLCLSIFDWSHYRQAKGAVKLHLVLDHDGYLPCFANITLAHRHDVPSARHFSFPAGSVVVVDRGYWSVDLFGQWLRDRVYFVTRTKSTIQLRVVEDRPVSGNVLCDQFVEFANPDTRKRYPYVLRRVVYRSPESGEQYIYITNLLGTEAQVIADVYRERWQIELFFKSLKQNLKLRCRRGWAMSNLVALLRWNLFTYRDLWAWLENPFAVPPGGPPVEQLLLEF